MSTDADKDPACPNVSGNSAKDEVSGILGPDTREAKRCKPSRKVSFPPEEDQLVTQYFEPANPWQDVPPTSREQLAAEYLEACRRHDTEPIESVLLQIQELPEACIGGLERAPRLTLSHCSLLGSGPADALEALLRKTQFRTVALHYSTVDDDGADALFEMIEYYESANKLTISGPREFDIRGWQAASRMIKKSVELSELEVSNSTLSGCGAAVLSRSLRAHTCGLLALCLQHASLTGEPLRCLVSALRSNKSVRELRLGDNQLVASDALQLASLLRVNARIQLLDLSNNVIEDKGAGHIADALVEQASLTPPSAATSPLSPLHAPVSGYDGRGLAFLVLWNNQLTKNSAEHLSKALCTSPSLRVLNVGRNALTGAWLARLPHTGALVSLGLQAAKLAGDSADPLAGLIAATACLQRLDLRDNKLGSAGLQAILAALNENNTIIQVDLDDCSTSTTTLTTDSNPDTATRSRLTREIKLQCRRNEACSAIAAEHRVHRKISLTCHTDRAVIRGATSPEEERRTRLRSPAPSPAPSPHPSPAPSAASSPSGSPVPGGMSRFSVTRVTPERESSTSSAESSSPSTPTRPSPSRFRVMQVSEPPQIQIQPCHSHTHTHTHSHTDTPRRLASRFSVTRNYDSMYEPSPPKRHVTAKRDDVTARRDHVTAGRDDGTAKREDVTARRDDVTARCDDVTAKLDDVTKTSDVKIGVKVLSDVISGVKVGCDAITDIKATSDVGSDVKLTSDVRKDVKVTSDVKLAGDVTVTSDVKVSAVTIIDASVQSDTAKSDSKGDFGKSDVKIESQVKCEGDLASDVRLRDIEDELSRVVIRDDKDILVSTERIQCVPDKSDSNSDRCKIVFSNAPAKVHNDQKPPSVVDDVVKTDKQQSKDTSDVAMNKIEAITQDLDNLIQEMQGFSHKTARKASEMEVKVRNDSTQTEISNIIDITIEKESTSKECLAKTIRDNVVLKKNKSESSLDSPDLEVSRLMKKSQPSPFRDSSSSLEISGSSMESLNALDNQNIPKINKPILEKIESELDRRKPETMLSAGSSLESASDNTANNSGHYLNTSVSSTESVSPIFGKDKKIHGSLSSLEASVSSLDSARCAERVMITSTDSGIEYSLHNPSESKEDTSSNEGTLTSNSNIKTNSPESLVGINVQATLTSPKRASSLLDVPATKNKSIDRTRKISWVAPSASFHIPKQEIELPKPVESKLPTNLEKLLSLFHNPGSLFSRNDDDKKSASNTPPRKESTSLSSSFWSWGSSEKSSEREEKSDSDSSPEVTDSTLSERVQVSFVDESFSRKLDSKTPSTDTDNTLSEFQSLAQNSEEIEPKVTTDDNLVQNRLDISCNTEASDSIDLMKPNDINRNVCDVQIDRAGDKIAAPDKEKPELSEAKNIEARPRSFAAVLKSSGSENSLDRPSPDNGQSVDKLPSKVIRGIKENISPENTLTSSMTNTKTLALELTDRQVKNQPIVNAVWEMTNPLVDIVVLSHDKPLDPAIETKSELLSLDSTENSGDHKRDNTSIEPTLKQQAESLEIVDLGKDALSYLIYENHDFEPDTETAVADIKSDKDVVLSEELRDAEIKHKMLDISPELVIDEIVAIPEVFTPTEAVAIPDRALIKKSNSLEELSQRLQSLGSTDSIKDAPKAKSKIVFKVPECSGTSPRDIPMRRPKLRSRSGSSPKSLPETLNRPLPISKLESVSFKKKKKVSSLGKIARDSLLALNKTDDEIADIRREYKLTSVESLRSLESVSEDANSQSGNSMDSRCRSCFRTSQESLMSLDSITEDCKCICDSDKGSPSTR